MAHKTLIGGTAYEISGGKTLIGGTAYSIKNGKTLVGGTAYEVGFGQPVTITVMGSGLDDYVYVTHNGTKYSSATTFTANVGDTIHCSCIECYSYHSIYFNGDMMADGFNENVDALAEYTVVSDTIIKISASDRVGTAERRQGEIHIEEAARVVTVTCEFFDYEDVEAFYKYNGSEYSFNDNWTDMLPLGTIIDVYAYSNDCRVYVNGSSVYSGKGVYHHTITTETIVRMDSPYVYITET